MSRGSITELSIRPFERGDLADLLEMQAASFPTKLSEARWRHLFEKRSVPCDTVWVAFLDGQLVCSVSGIALDYHTPDGPQVGLLNSQTMTRPKFRKRGIHHAVATKVYEHWTDAEIPFVIGVPSAPWTVNSAPRLGWRELITMRNWSRPLRSDLLGRVHDRVLRKLIPDTSAIRVAAITRTGLEFDALWSRVQPTLTTSVVRNARWVKWRYLDDPDRGYRVLGAFRGDNLDGYAVYRTENRTGQLAEMFYSPTDTAAGVALIEAVAHRCRNMGAERLDVLTAEHAPQESLLRRNGFWYPNERIAVHCLRTRPDREAHFRKDPARWLITAGDLDLV